MCVRCVFYEENEPCPCLVLRDAGILPDGVMESLERRYCRNGFLTCPIFVRVQRRLEAAHRLAERGPVWRGVRRESGVFRRIAIRRDRPGAASASGGDHRG